MEGLKKLAGAYLVIVAVAVAVFFIIGSFLSDAIDVLAVWHVLDVLMVIGLALGLIFNYMAKREADGAGDGPGTFRRSLEANVAFYATAGVTILFLHNWFALLSGVSLEGNDQAWVIWAAVDTVLPLVLGATGCRLWRGGSGS